MAFKGHTACISPSCGSSDALAISEDKEGLYYGKCFSCNSTFGHNAIARAYGDVYGIESKNFKDGEIDEDLEEYIEIMSRQPLSQEEREVVEGQSTLTGDGYRGITDETYKYYMVRHEYNEDGELNKQLYPVLEDGVFTGYKTRILPKDFSKPYGKFGASSDLFGAFRFQQKSRDIIITGGEIDCLTVYQVLKDYVVKRGKQDYGFTPVVSPLVGESCPKQLQNNYNYLDKFERILLAFDNDEAGRKAIDQVAKVLPKDKVFVISWSGKDPNDMLNKGQEKQIVNDFFSATKWTPTGIVGSSKLSNAIREELQTELLTLPPFMASLQDKLAGGLPLGIICNLASSSGAGKTTIINEMLYYWIFNSPHKLGVVSLELDQGQYGLAMLSRHVGKKINLMKDRTKALEFVNSPDVVEKEKELFSDEMGNDRWMLVDDRDGNTAVLRKKIEELIISCDCKIIVLDPLTDVLDGLSNEEQSVFMRWQKNIVKMYKVSFININHVRKSGGGEKATGQGKFITEDDIQGSSSIYKSAAANILFTRDKYTDCDVDRNTIKVVLSKNRVAGITGNSGEWYYDNETHTVWDKEHYFTHVNPVISEEI